MGNPGQRTHDYDHVVAASKIYLHTAPRSHKLLITARRYLLDDEESGRRMRSILEL